MIRIPFNKPSFTGRELEYIKKAVKSGKISGDGKFSTKCSRLIEKRFGINKILLTPSATAALEMTAILLNLKKGDEVIVPSFTFTSTVNAFVLHGAKPVFTDITADSFNIDPEKTEKNINSKTKAIVCIHYGSIASDLDRLKKLSKKYGIALIEDAAQSMNAKYKEKFLGTVGDLGAYSFHETKNFNCGEGGALAINNQKYVKRAEIIREKGTDRAAFFRGEVDKYTWRDLGSSYLLAEILSAYLYAQLQNLSKITKKRKQIFDYYFSHLSPFAKKGLIKLPFTPDGCVSNYHQFHILFNSKEERDRVMKTLKKKGILAVFHYLPLHSSLMGRTFGYKEGDFPITENVSSRLLRLPLYNSLSMINLDYIVKTLKNIIS